ncbi:MAG: hypothetical protein GQ574_18545 [Crocinitomix sp.]|nr:hypothetical protein [Crocinitomix sp.]
MYKKLFISIIAVSVVFVSCKKEATTWSTNWAAPIAHGHLTINDMVEEDHVETNSEGYLSLVIHEPVFEFSLDTLIQLPDTTVVEKTAIGIPSLDISPAYIQPTMYNQVLNLGTIELKEVIIGSGFIETRLTSVWPGRAQVALIIPEAIGPLGSFGSVHFFEAGHITETESSELTDMTDFNMNLTGDDGLSVNTIGITAIVQSNEETETYTITSSDTNTIGFSFIDMVPKYARGYFGQYTFSDTTTVSLSQLNRIVAGSIDIDSIDMKITVKNGFNLVAQSKISLFEGTNTRTGTTVDLDFPAKNTTMNIDPASGGLYDYVPSEYPLEINNVNSNITDFIENLPNSAKVGYKMDINPFGNISAGNDEFFPNSKMELFLDGEFPLSFGANELTIVDTFDIDWVDTGEITPEEAEVILDYSNGFPIGAIATFYLLDASNNVLDSIVGNSGILSGSFDAGTYETVPKDGSISFPITAATFENLEKMKRLKLYVSFSTDGTENIKISPETFFDFNLRSNLQISVSL